MDSMLRGGQNEVKEIMKMLEHEIDIQYTQGTRYVGGLIGSDAMAAVWIQPLVKIWVEGVKSLANVVTHFPKTTYVGLT